MNIKIIIISIFFVSINFSCNNYDKANSKTINTEENLKGYFENGKTKYKCSYKDSLKFCENYYKNGNLRSKGAFLKDTIPIGYWEYYNTSGKLKEKKELLLIENKSFLNQNKFYEDGKIVNEKSSYFEIELENDTINLNEPIKAKIDLISTYFKDNNSSIFVIVPKDYSENFNSMFSNVNRVDMDTTYNLNIEKEYREALGLTTDFRKTAIFGRYFKKPGKKRLRGILVEYFKPDSIGNNKFFEIKKYFDLPIFVKE